MIEINDFLTKKECDYFINFHKKNFNILPDGVKKMYESAEHVTEVISFPHLMDRDVFRNIFCKISQHIKNINKSLYINYCEIVKWRTLSYQGEHNDFDYHPFTSIIYLNDNYNGGETIVDDIKVKPKKGKIITFEGKKLKHKVNKITKGIRYTIPVWYKNIDEVTEWHTN